MKALDKTAQSQISPSDAITLLKEGNQRFVENRKVNRNLMEQVNDTSSGQYPYAVILSCIDSRTSSELIFDQGIGDVFNVRLAGNVLNEDALGSMEYACKVAGSKLVLVLGHTKCGAVTSACQKVELGNITALLNKIQPAVAEIAQKGLDVTQPENVQLVADANVSHVIKGIKEKSEILREMEANGSIQIIGGMYDVSSGLVTFFN